MTNLIEIIVKGIDLFRDFSKFFESSLNLKIKGIQLKEDEIWKNLIEILKKIEEFLRNLEKNWGEFFDLNFSNCKFRLLGVLNCMESKFNKLIKKGSIETMNEISGLFNEFYLSFEEAARFEDDFILKQLDKGVKS